MRDKVTSSSSKLLKFSSHPINLVFVFWKLLHSGRQQQQHYKFQLLFCGGMVVITRVGIFMEIIRECRMIRKVKFIRYPKYYFILPLWWNATGRWIDLRWEGGSLSLRYEHFGAIISEWFWYIVIASWLNSVVDFH